MPLTDFLPPQVSLKHLLKVSKCFVYTANSWLPKKNSGTFLVNEHAGEDTQVQQAPTFSPMLGALQWAASPAQLGRS